MSSARRLSFSPPRFAGDDGFDATPISFQLPFFCEMVQGPALEYCVGQECPLTLDPLTRDNLVAFRCSGGGSPKPSLSCYNMFALFYSFYNDVFGGFGRPVPILPHNRQPVTEQDQQILLTRVLSKLIENYAAEETHPDYPHVQTIRDLFAGQNIPELLGRLRN